ncbi:MAG: hypothetical protein ACREPN_00785 [Rudaea sp.]
MHPKYPLVLIAAAGLFAAGAQAQDQVTHFTAADGTHVTLTSGQPPQSHYGPPPAFATLDVDHNGAISREEAQAYPPLLNDFDYLAHHANHIAKSQYQRWVQNQH